MSNKIDIISLRMTRVVIVITTLLFFNYMYKLLINSDNAISTKYASFEESSTILKNKDTSIKIISAVYFTYIILKYKTIKEQIFVYIIFYVVILLTYIPFNCVCSDSYYWRCNPDTNIGSTECSRVNIEIKNVDNIISTHQKNIAEKKEVAYKNLLNLFPIVNYGGFPTMSSRAFEIPRIGGTGNIINRISFSCEINPAQIISKVLGAVAKKLSVW